MKIFCDMQSLTTADLAPGEKVMIGGDLLFVSLGESIPDVEEMVHQAPRPGSFKLFGDAVSVQAGVHEAVFTVMQSNPKARFGLTVDWYIDYLRKQKSDVVLIGGAVTSTGTNLEIFALQKGRVTLVLDKNLPMMRASSFQPELSVALEDIAQRMGVDQLPRVAWAYPLPEFDGSRFGNFEYIGAERFAKVALPAIQHHANRSSPLKTLAAPALVAAMGALVGAGMIYWEWQRYQSLQSDFNREIAGLESVYQDGASRLELLSKRQMMLDAPPAQKALLERWRDLAGAVAQLDGAVAQSIVVFDETSARSGLGGRQINFQLEMDVPAEPALSLRVQAKQVLTDLAEMTGYEFWMSQDEMGGDESTGMRRLQIEGMSSVR